MKTHRLANVEDMRTAKMRILGSSNDYRQMNSRGGVGDMQSNKTSHDMMHLQVSWNTLSPS